VGRRDGVILLTPLSPDGHTQPNQHPEKDRTTLFAYFRDSH
jgi:hypothetical protein